MPTLTLTPPAREPRPTSIIIGEGGIDDVGLSLGSFEGYDACVVLYDRGVEAIAQRVIAGFRREHRPTVHAIAVASGDASKSLAEVDRIVRTMLGVQCGRRTLLVAVGGGMLTDIGGFVASVFMRGIPCVLIPTSLLAMADAAIGGKTAVNCADHKNMIGNVTHSLAVIVDLSLLQELPAPQLCEGLVEIVKIAAIKDRTLFEWLEGNLKRVLKREPKALSECVTRAIRAKVATVESDEDDWSQRLTLNFGHTIGHAIEAMSHYQLSHGQAIAIGLVAEMKVTGFPQAARVTTLLTQLGMPLSIPAGFMAEELWHLMLVDKKSLQGSVRVAVPSAIGKGTLLTLERGAFDSLFSS